MFHRFDGGPSLADAAEQIGIQRRQQKEVNKPRDSTHVKPIAHQGCAAHMMLHHASVYSLLGSHILNSGLAACHKSHSFYPEWHGKSAVQQGMPADWNGAGSRGGRYQDIPDVRAWSLGQEHTQTSRLSCAAVKQDLNHKAGHPDLQDFMCSAGAGRALGSRRSQAARGGAGG